MITPNHFLRENCKLFRIFPYPDGSPSLTGRAGVGLWGGSFLALGARKFA